MCSRRAPLSGKSQAYAKSKVVPNYVAFFRDVFFFFFDLRGGSGMSFDNSPGVVVPGCLGTINLCGSFDHSPIGTAEYLDGEA